jgi:RNA polymerase sigma-70 factor (ECF subfamily)
MAQPSVTDPSATDLADLHALQRGEDSALNRLIERWERRLFGFAWRYVQNSTDARNLVAEAFVRLYQQRHCLARDTNLPAWLFTMLANLCRNHHRWHRRHPAFRPSSPEDSNELTTQLIDDAPLPADTLEQREKLAALAAAINRLPPDLKLTVLLHHYEQMSYREIAEITGCSEGGVDTRLCRARAKLRTALGVESA